MSTKFLLVAVAITVSVVGTFLWSDGRDAGAQGLERAPRVALHPNSSTPSAGNATEAREPNMGRLELEGPASSLESIPTSPEPEESADWILFGTLRDQSGKPVPGGELTIRIRQPWVGASLSVQRCDAQGQYRVPLTAPAHPISPHAVGEFKVSFAANAPGHHPTGSDLSLPQLQRGSSALIEFDPKIDVGWCMVGRVVDPSGQPVPGAEIAYSISNTGTVTSQSHKTGRGGEFKVRLHEGAEQIRAAAWHPSKGLGHSSAHPVGSGDLHLPDIVLHPTSRLHGRLTFPDGVPLANVNVEFKSQPPAEEFRLARCTLPGQDGPSLNRGHFQTDAGGRFSVDGLQQGAYSLILAERVLNSNVRPTLGLAATGVFFEAKVPLHSFRVRVVDEELLPLPGANVSMASGLNFKAEMGRIQVQANDIYGAQLASCSLKLTDAFDTARGFVSRHIPLDAAGCSDPVPAGSYKFRVESRSHAPSRAFNGHGEGVVEVLANETVQLSTTLPRNGRIKLSCTTSDGAKSPIQLDSVPFGSDRSPETMVLAVPFLDGLTYGPIHPGEVGYSPLMEPGTWRVRIHSPGYEDHEATVSIQSGQLTELNVELFRP